MNTTAFISSFASVLEKRPRLASAFGLALILGILAGIAYPSLDAPFILDDIDQLHQTATQNSVTDALQRDCYGLYRPVKTTVFFLLSSVFPDAPTLWRLTGLILYFSSIILFYTLAKRLFQRIWTALAAAAMWALAPTQVSTYAWCSCINIQIMTLAVLSAMLLFDLHQSERRSTARSALFVSGIALLYALAFFSYESSIVLPALLLVWSASRGQNIRTRKSLITLFVCGMTGLVLLAIRHAMKGDLNIENSSIHGFTPLQLSWASGRIIWDHFSLWFWPFGRQAITGTMVNGGQSMLALYFALPWIVIAAIALGALLMRKRCPMIALGLLFFFIAFFPMSNLFPLFNGPYADYYLVIPSIGLVFACMAAVNSVGEVREMQKKPLGRILILPVCILLGTKILAVGTSYTWSKAWKNEIELHRNTVRTFPQAYTAQSNLARSLQLQGAYAEAEAHARDAANAAPWFRQANYVLISIYLKTGRFDEALAETREVLKDNPKQVYLWSVLGYLAEYHLKDRAVAMDAYGRAQQLSWQAESENATINHARLLSLEGRDAEALGVLQQALARAPRARGLNVVYAAFNSDPDLFRDAIE